jgi:hypothetical protein
MLAQHYRGYEIQACTHGGWVIYRGDKQLTDKPVDSKVAARDLIDLWERDAEYEGYCDGAAARRAERDYE